MQNRPKAANKFSLKKPATINWENHGHGVADVAAAAYEQEYFDISPRQPLQRLASYDLSADYEVG